MDAHAEDRACLLREHSKDSATVLVGAEGEGAADMGRRSEELPTAPPSGEILYRSLLLIGHDALSDGLSILLGHPGVEFSYHLKHLTDCMQLEYCQGHSYRDLSDRSRPPNFHLQTSHGLS